MKFKVGDKVKVVNIKGFDRYDDVDKYVNQTGKMERYSSGGNFNYVIKFDNEEIEKDNIESGFWCFKESNLELIPETPKPTAQEMAKNFINKNEAEMVEFFESLGYEKTKKDPYNEYCTAQEILDSGIKLEKDMKVLVKMSLLEQNQASKRHFSNIDTKYIYSYDSGATSWSAIKESPWNYAKFVK